MIQQAIFWNPDPVLLNLGPVAIRWYGLLFAAGFLFGYIIIRRMFRNEGIGDEVLDRLTVYMVIGTVVGARLGHCLFYEPAYYLSNPLEILYIWRGGLASHGAAVGILLALWLFVRKEKKSYVWILDRIVIVVALAGVCIRLGNLMNSEIYGVETTLPWAFVFLRDLPGVLNSPEALEYLKLDASALASISRKGFVVISDSPFLGKHPTQIYEALAYLALFFAIYRIYWSTKGKMKPGLIFSVFLTVLFAARFLIEFIKEDQVAFESTMSLNMGQWLSIPFIIFGIGLFVWVLRGKAKS